MNISTSGKAEIKSNIEYAIAALCISAPEFTAIVQDATGLTIDPHASSALDLLDAFQLEAIWKRLSDEDRWKKKAVEQARTLKAHS